MNAIRKYFVIWALVYCCAGCGFVGLNEPKEAVYILPKGFLGPVIIVFDQPNGEQISIENGFHVYRVPISGVLITSNTATYDVDQMSFYYENEEGKRIELEYLFAASESNRSGRERKTFSDIHTGDKTTYVMGAEMGSFNSNIGVTRYRGFQVGRADRSEEIQLELRNKVTALQKTMNE